MNRFDGNAAWHALNWADKNVIGGIALELAVAWMGQVYHAGDGPEQSAHERAFDAAAAQLGTMLAEQVSERLADINLAPAPPLPSLLGPVCRVCGCSQDDACGPDFGGCHWIETDLCSACDPATPLHPPAEAA